MGLMIASIYTHEVHSLNPEFNQAFVSCAICREGCPFSAATYSPSSASKCQHN
jgi:hypothetical protein